MLLLINAVPMHMRCCGHPPHCGPGPLSGPDPECRVTQCPGTTLSTSPILSWSAYRQIHRAAGSRGFAKITYVFFSDSRRIILTTVGWGSRGKSISADHTLALCDLDLRPARTGWPFWRRQAYAVCIREVPYV